MKLAQRGPPETEDALPFLEVFIADASDEIRRKKTSEPQKKALWYSIILLGL